MRADLDGRVALVTGATAGLGLASAEALSARGARVALGGRRGALARSEAARLGGLGLELDLTDEASLAAAVAATEEALGPIDVLVLNGGGPPASTAASLEVPAAKQAAELLLYGPMRLVGHCLSPMRERRWGRIVSIGSSAVAQPIGRLCTSSMFRSALASYLKLLAEEVAAEGVTVNMVLPGRFATARVDETDAAQAARTNRTIEEVRRASAQGIPAGRYGEPAELGAAVAFLSSDEARYLTGEQIRVDGGLVRAL